MNANQFQTKENSMNYATPGNMAVSIGNSALAQPVREGGLQMRLTETFKMLSDAHNCLSRIENSLGCGSPSTVEDKPAGPMNIDGLTMQVRDLMAGICERLGRIEQQF